MREGVLRRAAKPPAAKPLFNPPSPQSEAMGRGGIKGGEGNQQPLWRTRY
jgi:hypothetical protein